MRSSERLEDESKKRWWGSRVVLEPEIESVGEERKEDSNEVKITRLTLDLSPPISATLSCRCAVKAISRCYTPKSYLVRQTDQRTQQLTAYNGDGDALECFPRNRIASLM